jgi:hypothetical protein
MLETKVAEHVARVGKYALERLKSDFGPLPCVGGIGGGAARAWLNAQHGNSG